MEDALKAAIEYLIETTRQEAYRHSEAAARSKAERKYSSAEYSRGRMEQCHITTTKLERILVGYTTNVE